MTGVLLAAGVGSRLRPLTNDRPKCLLEVGGTPLLARTLRALEAAGLERCVIVTGYLQAMVEEAAQAFAPALPLQFVRNEQFSSTNNNYSLWLACRHTGGADMLLLDADILFDPHLLRLLLDAPEPDALLMRSDGPLGAEEIKLQLAEHRMVRRIGKEIDPARAAGESIGIEKFSAPAAGALLAILERRKDRYEFYEASFQELIDGGACLAAVPTEGLACMEIDTPGDLEAADRLARARGL